MKKLRETICLVCLSVLAACSEEPPPVSVGELMENPRLLEATMVRCAQNRAEARYIAECVNAREAVNRIEAGQEKARREELEKQSERKRQALRRTQEAAAEARRRALEAQRRQEEEEYLGLFDGTEGGVEEVLPRTDVPQASPASNAPAAIIEPPASVPEENTQPVEDEVPEPATDLEAIREELRRRQESVEN